MRAHLFSVGVLLAVGVACGVEVSIDGKPCPCGPGYTCDQVRKICVLPGSETPEAGAPQPDAGAATCDPCPCNTNAECTDPDRPFCAPDSKTCVECNPADDKCRAGTYCNAKFQCAVGCKTSEECAQLAKLSPICNTARHQCVTCLDKSSCPGGQECSDSGACVAACAGADGTDCNNSGVPGKCCGGLCLDVSQDVLNCGACKTVCASTDGTPKCSAGKCGADCTAGHATCGEAQCGTETSRDPKNCGACGNVCTFDHVAVEQVTCSGGKCGFRDCLQGWDNANRIAADGCEHKCGFEGDDCCIRGDKDDICFEGQCKGGGQGRRCQ
ncbi:MAG: hypothetical protein U0270_38510 [Labilithrix sp.]